VPKTLCPIFRDRVDFSAGHSLNKQTLAALEASQFLIVLCSPNAANSHYVNEEVRRFKLLGRAEQIISVIVDGEPGDKDRECFPATLRFRVGTDGRLTDVLEEPLAADARRNHDGRDIAKQKVIAGLLGLDLDDIMRRSDRARKRHNQFWGTLAGVFLLLAVTATGSAIYAWQQLRTNEAFLNSTLRRATDIVNAAVSQAVKYNVPRAATLDLLTQAEGLFNDMAQLGRPTLELKYRKALMLSEFSRNYAVLGRSDLQRMRAEAAVELCEELTKAQQDNADWQDALGRAYIDLGDALQTQGQIDAALTQYNVSLFIGNRFANSTTAASRFLQMVSLSSERIADMLKSQGHFSEALKYYEQDLRLNQNNPVAHERIGTTLFDAEDKSGALRQYQQMLALYEFYAEADPTNADLQRSLSVSHYDIGSVYLSLGRLTDALDEFHIDLDIINRLAATDPSRGTWQRDLAFTHGMIGEVLLAQGRAEEARGSYSEQLKIMTRLVASDQKSSFWQIDLATTHASIADTFIAEGRLDEALSSYRASHKIWERVVAIDPTNVSAMLDLLWSHSRLTLFGDDPLSRWNFIVSTLRELHNKHRLRKDQERWLPAAEAGLAAVSPTNNKWKWDLLMIYWNTAHFTRNPIRQATLVIAMLRQLKEQGQLTTEQERSLEFFEQRLSFFRYTGAKVASLIDCESMQPDHALEGCTQIINSGLLSAQLLTTAYQIRGDAYRQKAQVDEAISDYAEAIRIDPNTASAYNARALAYQIKGNTEHTLRDFTEAIRLDANYTTAYRNRGIVYSNIGDFDRAIADFGESIRLEPKSAVSHNLRGVAFLRKNELDMALIDFSEAIQLDPKLKVAFINRADVYRAKRQLEDAVIDYDKAIEIDPSDPVSYNLRGVAHFQNNELDQAFSDFSEAVRLDPKNAIGYTNRGRVYELQGRFDQALAEHEAALKIDPKLAIAHANWGLAYEGKGDRTNALAEFEAALAIDPKLQRAIDGRDRLRAVK
jgi:tetratricopeptide (TPR) repeat protein